MSVCVKCGYPAENHPFKHHLFVTVRTPATKPPAPESPYVPLVCGVGDVEALRAELSAVKAKLKATETAFAQSIASQFTVTFCGAAQSEWLRLCHDFGNPATIRSAIEDRDAARTSIESLLKSSARIRAEERERCAKVVETYSNSERATDLILAEIRNPKGAR